MNQRTMKTKLVVLSLVAILLAGCSVQVKSLYDTDIDFTNYKTYCWLQGCEFSITGPSYIQDDTLRNHLEEAIVAVLNSKGLSQEPDNADLLIDFHMLFEIQSTVEYHDEYHDDQYSLYPESDVEYVDYLKGTLVIDIVDRAKSKMVWRSAAIRYMDINPKLTRENLEKGISRALKDFPPKGK